MLKEKKIIFYFFSKIIYLIFFAFSFCFLLFFDKKYFIFFLHAFNDNSPSPIIIDDEEPNNFFKTNHKTSINIEAQLSLKLTDLTSLNEEEEKKIFFKTTIKDTASKFFKFKIELLKGNKLLNLKKNNNKTSEELLKIEENIKRIKDNSDREIENKDNIEKEIKNIKEKLTQQKKVYEEGIEKFEKQLLYEKAKNNRKKDLKLIEDLEFLIANIRGSNLLQKNLSFDNSLINKINSSLNNKSNKYIDLWEYDIVKNQGQIKSIQNEWNDINDELNILSEVFSKDNFDVHSRWVIWSQKTYTSKKLDQQLQTDFKEWKKQLLVSYDYVNKCLDKLSDYVNNIFKIRKNVSKSPYDIDYNEYLMNKIQNQILQNQEFLFLNLDFRVFGGDDNGLMTDEFDFYLKHDQDISEIVPIQNGIKRCKIPFKIDQNQNCYEPIEIIVQLRAEKAKTTGTSSKPSKLSYLLHPEKSIILSLDMDVVDYNDFLFANKKDIRNNVNVHFNNIDFNDIEILPSENIDNKNNINRTHQPYFCKPHSNIFNNFNNIKHYLFYVDYEMTSKLNSNTDDLKKLFQDIIEKNNLPWEKTIIYFLWLDEELNNILCKAKITNKYANVFIEREKTTEALRDFFNILKQTSPTDNIVCFWSQKRYKLNPLQNKYNYSENNDDYINKSDIHQLIKIQIVNAIFTDVFNDIDKLGTSLIERKHNEWNNQAGVIPSSPSPAVIFSSPSSLHSFRNRKHPIT